MASFHKAVQMGVDMIEFDVLTTQDKVVVCHHDPLIEETGKTFPFIFCLCRFLGLVCVRVSADGKGYCRPLFLIHLKGKVFENNHAQDTEKI